MSFRTWAWVACALLVSHSGCSCAGGTLGEPCSTDADCDTGQVCNPSTMVCWAPDIDTGVDGGATPTDGPQPTDGNVSSDGPVVMNDGTVASDGVVCTDADDDGVTDCAGDCDDSDPSTYPGAPEVCGDGIANDCAGAPDAGCGGLGTYVAPPPLGDDANPGTQAMPVATIGQGMSNAMTIGGGVDVFVAAGTYSEDVTMVEGISLHGGYESAGWTPSPAANVTTIRPSTDAGVLFPHGITRATSIDGFTITAHGGLSGSAAVTVMDSSSPVIENDVISASNATSNSAAVRVNPASVPNASASPLVRRNEIRLAGAGTGWGGGNGSWGIRADRTAVEILGNHIFLAEAATVQRGMELFGCPDSTIVSRNVVRHPSGRADVAFGIRLASSGGTLDSNDVWGGRCSSFCVGIALEGSLTTVVVTNNVSYGGDGAANDSAGLWIAFEGLPTTTPDVLVHSNVLEGGAGGGRTSGAWLGEHPTSHIAVGRFFDNILRSGTGATRVALWENDANIDPERFENNALYVSPGGSGIARTVYHDEGLIDLSTAVTINALPSSANNIVDDCSVVDPRVDGDFHLGSGSMCIDAGTTTEMPATDYEGDARPGGAAPDIGVDET